MKCLRKLLKQLQSLMYLSQCLRFAFFIIYSAINIALSENWNILKPQTNVT